MIIFGIQMKAITKYIATLIYLLIYLSHTLQSNTKLYYINNALAVLYGPIWAVAICGVLINNFFHDKIRERDNTTSLVRIFSDIFGHILPLLFIYYYGPTKTTVSFMYYTISIIMFFVLFKNYLVDTYIGVPPSLLLLIAPLISITMFYVRFIFGT
jgi:hypothetical protein